MLLFSIDGSLGRTDVRDTKLLGYLKIQYNDHKEDKWN